MGSTALPLPKDAITNTNEAKLPADATSAPTTPVSSTTLHPVSSKAESFDDNIQEQQYLRHLRQGTEINWAGQPIEKVTPNLKQGETVNIGKIPEKPLSPLPPDMFQQPEAAAYWYTKAGHPTAAKTALAIAGVRKGLTDSVKNLIDPANLAFLVGTEGLGEVVPIITDLINAGFTTYQIKTAIDTIPNVRTAIRNHDPETAAQLMTEGGIATAFSVVGTLHGIKEIKKTSKIKPANIDIVSNNSISFAKDSNGITWATDKSVSPNPVSIPDDIPANEQEQYAADKLKQQGEIAAAIKKRLLAIPGAIEVPQNTKYTDFLNKAITRAVQEGYGQSILDDMSDKNISPKDVTRQFWDKTYFELPAESQQKFQNYLRKVTGFKPGDVIGVNADKTPMIAQDWADIADKILDVGDDAEYLEGTTRGLVAGMKEANDLIAKKSKLSEIPKTINLLSQATTAPVTESYHPDLQKVVDKYGETENASGTKNGDSLEQRLADLKGEVSKTSHATLAPIPISLKSDNPAITDESIHGHEYGHGAQAIINDAQLAELRSYMHPENIGKATAAAVIRWPSGGAKTYDEWIAKDPNNALNTIQNALAGPLTQEVLYGIPIEDNPGASGDMRDIRQALDTLGLTPAQETDVLSYLSQGWKDKLTAKNPLTGRTLGDIIKQYAPRDENIRAELLASPKKIDKFAEEVRQHENEVRQHENRQRKGNNRRNVAGVSEGTKQVGRENVARTERVSAKSNISKSLRAIQGAIQIKP